MNITVIHGQSHKGISYTMTHMVLDRLLRAEDTLSEFFLPADGPGFCRGCNSCFLRGEENCPDANKVQPIMQAIERANILILDSPNYVLEMSGAMKNLFDHFAYRWVTHRPDGAMFFKVGLTVSSSAGAPATHTVKSMARQLNWMCCPKVYLFPFISNAMGVDDLKPDKRAKMEKKAAELATSLRRRAEHPRASLRAKLLFGMFRGMQSSPTSSWNLTDRDWWKKQGWLADKRPWKKL